PILRTGAKSAWEGYKKAAPVMMKHLTYEALEGATDLAHLFGMTTSETHRRWTDYLEARRAEGDAAGGDWQFLRLAQRMGAVTEIGAQQILLERFYGYDKPLAKWEAAYFKLNLLEPL